MRKIIYFSRVVVLSTIAMTILSCQSPTLEQQIEKLMKTADEQKRKDIAYALADSLEPRAVDLIVGLYGENIYAARALEDMLTRSKQDVKFSAADALVKMLKYNPDAVQNLMQAFDNSSIGAIAKNYPFYIRMGLQGTEALLLKALRCNFSKEMCIDYLNCENETIEKGAEKNAEEHGFYVYSHFGIHSCPRWSEGN